MKYSDIIKKEKALAVKINDIVVNVVYDSSKISHKYLFNKELKNDGETYNIKLLLECLVSWDLQDDNDKVLPIDFDTLDGMNTGFLNIIAEAIIMDGATLKKK